MATAPTLKISAAFRHYTDWQKSCGRKESSIKLNSYAQALLTEYLSAANGMPEEASASESSARAVSEHSTDTTETPLNTRSSSVQCLDQLDRFTIRSFLLWLREEKKLSGSTAQRVYDVLSAMYKFLVAEELIADNPMDKVEKPRREIHPIVPLTAEQVQKLIDSCSAKTFPGVRNRLIIALMFDTGVRATELSMVDVADVDMDQHRILLRQTKTGVPRFTYFSSVVARQLSRYLVLREAYPPGKLIITNRGGRITRHFLKQLFERVGENAGVKVHAHLLRHSCGVESIKNGSDISSVMRLLGHSNPRMSLHYMQLADKDVQEIQSRTSPADKLSLTTTSSGGRKQAAKRTNQ